jgi:uncharacterized membrane protein
MYIPNIQDIHDFIAKLSLMTIIAYIISWGVFLLVLPGMISLFGKLYGTAITYGISWSTMLIIIFLTGKLHDGKTIAEIIKIITELLIEG